MAADFSKRKMKGNILKVLLINPPFLPEKGKFSRSQRSPAITKGGTFYYPMWLCYAAGVLEDHGFDVRLTDAVAQGLSKQEALSGGVSFDPELIVVDTSTPSIHNDVAFAVELAEATGAFVVLVGTHPSAMAESTLAISERVDAVARREYDFTVLELAQSVEKNGGRPDLAGLQKIAGLSFRHEGRIYHNPDRPPIEDLDQLPFLARVYKDHLNFRDYFYTMCQYPLVTIFSGRGCPHHCVYCVYPQVMHGHKYRKRSIENLVEEFKYIERELPEVREIFIEDDTFTVDRNRVQAFSQAYRQAGLKISWVANSRADISLETLQALKSCNCRILCVGFESGDQAVLDAMKKKLKVDKAHQFVADAKRVGILIHGCFLVGNPGETKASLETTLAYAKAINPDTAQFFPIMVYPGTEAYGWAQENHFLLSEDFTRWNTSDGLHNCLVSRPDLTNLELVQFCDRARKEFYLRFSYLMYRLVRLAKHPVEDGPRMWKSMKVFWKFLRRGSVTEDKCTPEASTR